MYDATLELSKPVGMMSKKIRVDDYKHLLSSLGGMVIHAATLQWNETAKSAIDTLAALGLTNDSSELAWVLVNRAMMNAISVLIYENRSLIKLNSENQFIELADNLFESDELSIDSNFFEKPRRNKIVANTQELLRQWLKCMEVSQAEADAIVYRLPAFFIYELNDEWKCNESYYQPIRNEFDSPFFSATQKEMEWERYSAYLEKQINESVFGESFGLNQIYIPLCGYYIEKLEEQERLNLSTPKRRIADDLEEHINKWLAKDDKKDFLRVISGGPGSGKSSFSKVLAAKLSLSRRVLFIPLHQIDLQNDLSVAIKNFVQWNNFFSYSPYEDEADLIVIFDGLDELVQQGKTCTDAAKHFLDTIERYASSRNNSAKLKIIITGRDVVMQSNENFFRKGAILLHVLPYYVDEKSRWNYKDLQNLLGEDKRNVWWQKYGELTGREYTAMPEKLRIKKLNELTSHPLLNYLIAMNFNSQSIEYAENTNMNLVYANLIKGVYKRGYESSIHRTVRNISEEQFNAILEEIAISSWHGDGRTTTIKEIEDHCQDAPTRVLLERFKQGAESGAINFLIAFYFRQSGLNASGEQTFEFTHKSFCEYLVSKRIVRQLKMSAKMLSDERKDTYEGWDYKTALCNWAELCGKSQLDEYIFKFLYDELAVQNDGQEDVEFWQTMLCHMIEYMLKNGIPFENFDQRPIFLEESRQSRNAEESLLASLSACSHVTNLISNIKWDCNETASKWFRKLQERNYEPNSITQKCLNNLNLSNCLLPSQVFISAKLEYSHLSRSSLVSADLRDADLRRANLQGADLRRANLQGADLQGADLQDADLQDADLQSVNLQNANLQGANFLGSNLRNANFQNGDLRNANFQNVDFRWTKLRNAQLQGAKLQEAKLRGVDLRNMDLRYTDLRNADFGNADLRNVDLRFTRLQGVVLRGAKLQGAILQVFDLQVPDLQEFVSLGDDLLGVDFREVDWEVQSYH